jgi:4-hydroxybenzoate polyprenyltransferase
LFTALVPIIALIYDMIPLYRAYLPVDEHLSFIDAWHYTFALAIFAFITTLLREIVKDIEDVEGDRAYGCNTLPIALGIDSAKNIAIIIILATIFSLGVIQKQFLKLDDKISFVYFIVALHLPLLFLIYKIRKAKEKKQFHFTARLIKFVMLMGIMYLLVFSYNILHEYLHAF